MKQGSIANLFKRKLDVGISDESGRGKRPQGPQPQPQPSLSSFDINNIPSDPTDRLRITSYHPNQRDEIRRAYWIKGPFQPKGHVFPPTRIGNKNRRFVKEWFDEFYWLEYNIKEDKAYCLCCYLFGDIVGQQGGRDVFVTEGFNSWGKKKVLTDHVGNVDSHHNKARQKCENLVKILGLTDTLSKHLQRKDQDILEAVSLVKSTMRKLKALRNDGFPSMLENVFSICRKHNIGIVKMPEIYITPRNRRTKVTNQHHFEVDIFNTVLDMQILEFGDRFSETTTELIENMAALSPCDSFSMFDKLKLVKLSELYKKDFNDSERVQLDGQLEVYCDSLINDERFSNLKGIAELSRLMVETKKHRSFPLVYRLLKLTLVLPVATVTVERCFSAMKLLKTVLRNKMGDEFMNDALICSVEKQALMDVSIEKVMNRYQKMSKRRGQA